MLHFRYRSVCQQERKTKERSKHASPSQANAAVSLCRWHRHQGQQRRWSDSTRLTVGKLNEKLDFSYSSYPSGFLEDNLQTTDFEDRRGRTRGFLLLARQTDGTAWSAKLIYSDDRCTSTAYDYLNINPGYKRGLRQWIAVWRRGHVNLTCHRLKPSQNEKTQE